MTAVTYKESADNGLQESVGLLEPGEGVLGQLWLLFEDGRVAGSREEHVAKLVLVGENSGVGHVVGKLAASLLEVLAFVVSEERLLVASSVAIGDRSTRVEVRSLSHSMCREERMGLTGMRERRRFIVVLVVVGIVVGSLRRPRYGLERKETEIAEFRVNNQSREQKAFKNGGTNEGQRRAMAEDGGRSSSS